MSGEVPSAEPSPMPPAGWHDDPNDPTSLRYWNGTAWTDQRAPRPNDCTERSGDDIETAAALVYDYTNVSRNVDIDEEFARASVGWGLQLATLGAVVAAIATFLLWRGAKANPVDPRSATDLEP